MAKKPSIDDNNEDHNRHNIQPSNTIMSLQTVFSNGGTNSTINHEFVAE